MCNAIDNRESQMATTIYNELLEQLYEPLKTDIGINVAYLFHFAVIYYNTYYEMLHMYMYYIVELELIAYKYASTTTHNWGYYKKIVDSVNDSYIKLNEFDLKVDDGTQRLTTKVKAALYKRSMNVETRQR
jgi:hypothetical protein